MISAAATGAAATVLSCGVQPRQAWHAFSHRHSAKELDALSVSGAVIVLRISLLWVAYGVSTGAYFAGVLAAVEGVCQVAILGVLAHGVPRCRRDILISIPLTVGLALVLAFGSINLTFMGTLASAASLFMFVFPAKEQWEHRHDDTIGYTWSATMLVLCANVLWTVYGVLHQDVWLTVPSLVHVVLGVVIAGSKLVSAKSA